MPRGDVQLQPRPVDWRLYEWASCTRKMVFPSRANADKFNTDPDQHAYRCSFDNTHWHLGHPLTKRELRKLAFALRARQIERAEQPQRQDENTDAGAR